VAAFGDKEEFLTNVNVPRMKGNQVFQMKNPNSEFVVMYIML
jgi:hypothetical protein